MCKKYCKKLCKKTKKCFFQEAWNGTVTNKTFWELVKPFISNKGNYSSGTISIKENEKIIDDEREVVDLFNNHYVNIVENTSGITPESSKLSSNHKNDLSDVTKILKNFQNSSVISNIMKPPPLSEKFNLPKAEVSEINELLMSLNTKKATGPDSIPPKIVKLSANVIDAHLCNIINMSIETSSFPDDAKLASVVPIYKKKCRQKMENYRPVSILNCFSKIFERFIHNSITPFVENLLSESVSAYRKNYNSSHVLIKLIENWKKSLDNKMLVGAVLMDLSKAFDCIPHDILITKMHAYGFSKNTLTFFYSYLKRRKQYVKINETCSDFKTILTGVPQGSILGPVLFNLFINDLFYSIKEADLYNFADDNTIYTYGFNLGNIFRKLQNDLQNILLWLENNSLKANPVKFQFMILGNVTGKYFYLNFNDISFKAADSVKVLRIEIDENINFNHHIMNLSKKANSKLYALRRIRNYITEENSKVIMNSFILSQFRYCSLIWMFCSKKAYTKIKNIHFRSVFDNYEMKYEELLEMCNSVSIHSLHLQSLMIEIFKC